MHGISPFNEKKQCQLCEASSDSKVTTKLYTIKEIIIISSPIDVFHKEYKIPSIEKLAFYLSHIILFVTDHFRKQREE